MNISYRLVVIAIFLLGAFLAGGSLWAKEDTAYLTFRKSAPSKPVITVYTVKKGEWLLAIGRRVMGKTKHVYSILRKYNPGIKNLNLIYPGQKIILPVKAAITATSTDTPRSGAPPHSQQAGALKDDRPYPTQTKWALIKQVLGQISATVTWTGKYYLPLRDMGQITIDCRKIPMVEFADGGIVFIDFRDQIPDDLTQLVRRTWKHYAIINMDPQAEALITLGADHSGINHPYHAQTGRTLKNRIPADPGDSRHLGDKEQIVGGADQQPSCHSSLAQIGRSSCSPGANHSLCRGKGLGDSRSASGKNRQGPSWRSDSGQTGI